MSTSIQFHKYTIYRRNTWGVDPHGWVMKLDHMKLDH